MLVPLLLFCKPPDITKVEITLAPTLAKLKSAKSKVVIQEPVQSTGTTTPLTIPKANGITFKDAGESTIRTPTLVSSSIIKDKGKAKMDEPEVPLKKKDQITLDEEMARNLEDQIQAKLIEEERLARKKEEEANIALIESWDNTQAMMEADFKKKHFTKLRGEEKRRKPPIKAQKRNLMSTYLKNIEVVKGSETRIEESSKRAGNELESNKSKKQKIDEQLFEAEKVAIEGFLSLIKADGSSKRYSSMIRMLQGIDREDLETLWKLVKERHGINRPVNEYERVFYGEI
ncbi:hypothetical protein Tco_0999577 [Tanacetum coccineum]